MKTAKRTLFHIVTSLEVGGVERVVVQLGALQVKQGFDVHIVCIYTGGALVNAAQAAGMTVHILDKSSGKPFLQLLQQLRSILHRFSSSVVHTHNLVPHYYASFASLGLKRVTLVNSRHDMGEHYSSKQGRALYWLTRINTHAFVAVCEKAKDKFLTTGEFPPNKANVVVNGIDLSVFKNLVGPKPVELLKNRLTQFVSVGRCHPVKNHLLMLEAFKLALARGCKGQLTIVGDGSTLNELQRFVAENKLEASIVFLGARSDIPDILIKSDVFVQSSKTEGYSLALVEACAAALPIIATNVGGNSEIVSHQHNGLLIDNFSVEQMAQAMASLADQSNGMRSAMSKQAYEWAHREGSIDMMSRNYQRIYEAQ
jgi:glycosyltransferase involved in cell wall biosynthesis